MPRKFLLCMAALACLMQCAFCIQNPPAFAQESSLADTDPLAHGRQLEIEQRWQEAIAHYEKHTRKSHDRADLAHRLQIVRIHYDVWRRYTDQTFIATVDNSSMQQAIALYAEILSKLELYYVDAVKLEDLLRNGTAYLEVALTEKDFLEQNVSRVPADRVENFRVNVHRMVLGQSISNVRDAQQIVMNVATQARDQIGVAPTAVVYEYIAGAVGMLDPYSAYLTAGEYQEMMSQIKGNLIGIGVELWAEQNDLEVVDVFADGPAYESGLRAGDRIVSIDNKVVANLGAKRAADLLRGTEHSRVTVNVERADGSRRSFDVTRRNVDVRSVNDVRIVDNAYGIGYVRIANFQMTTPSEVDSAINNLSKQGMRSLIIDVRGNPGGLLEAAVELADRFIENGSIVSTRGRNGAENHNYAAQMPNTTSMPLMVMIDEDSASASEIFAGAIRDNNRGVIVGRTSYGKGTVQGVFHNDSGSGGIRLTVSKFYAPTGYAISHRGIEPHIVFPSHKESETSTMAKPSIDKASNEYFVSKVGPNGSASNPSRFADRRKERLQRQQLEGEDLQQAIAEARRAFR
jgi:carboxyl-terminal processing protease